jgi:hypothetical protein
MVPDYVSRAYLDWLDIDQRLLTFEVVDVAR